MDHLRRLHLSRAHGRSAWRRPQPSPRAVRFAWFVAVIAVAVFVVSGCAPPPPESLEAAGGVRDPGDGAVDSSGDAGRVLDRLVTADTAQVSQRLSIVVPDDAGASTYYELDAGLDLAADRFVGTLDNWADEGEEGPMATWPDAVPTDRTVRIIAGEVFMRWGGEEDGYDWHDITSLADLPPAVNHLRSVRPLAVLLAEAVAQRPPSAVVGSEAMWQGTVPPALLEEWVGHPGPIGSVSRFAAGMPAEANDDVHVFEVEERSDGSVRLSLWLDMSRLGANVGEAIPEGVLSVRVDAQWSGLGEPVEVVRPESVADLNQP